MGQNHLRALSETERQIVKLTAQDAQELVDALKEHQAVIAEEKRMDREYPMGTCNAEDAWRDFFKRKNASDTNLRRLANKF